MFRDFFLDRIAVIQSQPYAVVIEPRLDLAEVISDALSLSGFDVTNAATHRGAAKASEGRCPQLLVACVPAHAQDCHGAYLEECREALGSIPTVLLEAEPDSDAGRAPIYAIRLLKPFTRKELLCAVDEALAMKHGSLA